jgi:hypothetical protein
VHGRIRLRPGRAVHEHVEPAELAYGLLDRALAVRALPDVGDDRDAAAPELAHLFGRARGLGRVDLGDPDVGALARVRERDRAPDPLPRAGDQRDATCEPSPALMCPPRARPTPGSRSCAESR